MWRASIHLSRAGWVAVLVVGTGLATVALADPARPQGDAAEPAEASAPVLYVQESTATYFKGSGATFEEIASRRDVALCRVRRRGNEFVSDERMVVFNSREDGTVEPSQVLTATRRYNLAQGERPPFSKTAFVADMPHTSFELFYFPMLDLSDPTAALNMKGVARLHTDKAYTPDFSGEWAYECREEGGKLRVSGPFSVESNMAKWLVAGTFEHRIERQPFRVERMSGQAIVRIQSNDRELLPGNLYPRATRTGNVTDVIGRFAFRMVPAESDEGRSIELPKSLSTAGEEASAELDGTKSGGQQIRAEDVGKSVTILGKLGKPLGELVTVRGKWIEPKGPVKDNTPAFHVLAIDGKHLQKPVELFGQFVEPIFDLREGRANAEGNWDWKWKPRGSARPPEIVSAMKEAGIWPSATPYYYGIGLYTTFEFIGVRIIEGGK